MFVQALDNQALTSLVVQKGAFESVLQPVRELMSSIDKSVDTISTQASTLLHAESAAGQDLEKTLLLGLGEAGKRDSPDDAGTAAAKPTKQPRTNPELLKGQCSIAKSWAGNFSRENVCDPNPSIYPCVWI